MSKLIVKFSDRDSADLALMRLRRCGIDFNAEKLETAESPHNTDFPGELVNIVYPYGLASSNPVGSSENSVIPTIGARALFSRRTPPDGEATLHLSVRMAHLSRAQEILRSAGGRLAGSE